MITEQMTRRFQEHKKVSDVLQKKLNNLSRHEIAKLASQILKVLSESK